MIPQNPKIELHPKGGRSSTMRGHVRLGGGKDNEALRVIRIQGGPKP